MFARLSRKPVPTLLALLATSSALCCAQPLCQRPRAASAVAADAPAEAIEPAFWAALLLADAVHDCRGAAAIAAPQGSSDAPVQHDGPQAVRRTFGRADVVLSEPLDGAAARRLVWLKVQRHDGMISGPVALVAIGPRRVEVLAIGPLSLPEGDTALHYVDLHEFFAVRVDVKRCAAHKMSQQPICHQFMRLLPNISGQLRAGSADAADMELRAVHELPAERRLWARRVEHSAEVELCQGNVILSESAALREYHLTRAGLPPRVVRQAEAIRTWRWENNRWQPSDPPLWQMMAQSEAPKRL